VLKLTVHLKRTHTGTKINVRKVLKILLVCMFLWSFLAFETVDREDFSLPEGKSKGNNPETCDSLICFAKNYLHKPYCYGSRPPSCFDCSGFTAFVFNHFNAQLPHSSGSMAFLGKFVSFKHASPGDLVFFNGRASGNETIGHVGIVTEFRDGKIFFIHASVQAGVIISNSEEAYYKKRFMFVKRIKL
jgi:cell wall-associated NlpC family hydrolase